MPEMVRGERNLPTDLLPDPGKVRTHYVDTLRGQFQSREHMLHREVAGACRRASGSTAARGLPLGTDEHADVGAVGIGHGAGDIGEHRGPNIRLKPGETLRFADLHALGEDFGIIRFRRIAIDPDAVAVLTA